ncbi:MAG: DUF3810 family protein [Vicinamibacterales bacterium]
MLLTGLLVLMSLAALLAPLPPALVERWYSQGLYLSVRQHLTAWTSLARFTIFDLVVIGVAAWLLVAVVLALRAALSWRVGTIVRIARRTILLAAAGYLAFDLLWGLNYARERLERRMTFDAARVTPERALAVGRRAVAELNRLHPLAHSRPWPAFADVPLDLRDAFAAALGALGQPTPSPLVAPKPTIVAPYLRWASVDGMTSPFTLEVLVNPWALPFERQMILAHEWGHVAGFARESEASFVGLAACLGGSVQAQYSAWLFLLPHVAGSVPRDIRAALVATLDPGPRADLQAVSDRLRQAIPAVRDAAWRAYDSYLKANRVPSGNANYDEVVTLVLGSGLVELDEHAAAAPR